MADDKTMSRLLGGIVDSIGDGAALYDTDDCLIQCNKNYIRYFGDVAGDIQSGMSFRQVMGLAARHWYAERSEYEIEKWIEERITLFNKGIKNNEILRSDGSWIGLDYYKIEGGGTFVFTANISQRKNMETALKAAKEELEGRVAQRTAELEQALELLRANEQRLTDFATISSDWLWEMDAALKYTFFSERNREVTGQDPSLFLGKARQDVSNETVDSEKWKAHLADLEAHRPFKDFTYPLKVSDGRKMLISINGKPVFDERGHFAGYRGSGTDITEKSRLVEEMKRNEMLFEGLFQTSAVGMVLHAADGSRRIRVNDRFCQMVGHSEAALLREPYANLTHPDDLAESMEMRRRVESGEIDYCVLEKRYIHKKGHAVWGSALLSVVRDEDGNVLNYISIIQDISRRKADEISLLEAKDRSEIANRAKSDFLANMSHELRTPLNSIIGFSSVLAGEMYGSHSVDKYRDYSRNIQKSGEHLLQLINDILDLSRIESDVTIARPQNVDILRTIDSCLKMSEFQSQQAQVRLVFDAPQDIPTIRADVMHMKQIVLNLLSNAIKFTPKGGEITLKLDVDDQRNVVLDVTDTGIGIAADDIPKVLEPFGQVTDAMTRNHDGAGLGLAIVNALVKLNAGKMEIKSTLGDGTTVTLRFPQA